ncbi:hypothetical protein L3X38_015106 [Prunus dulcis]|uniref:Uncharacterized protein n=1 Tax=Prunus dulcis TaxID=3755 RepID=A0AAD4ZHQ5_PRUDU|nr:hypothetical protein L3X38_015106 [Prunus dulcis]
MSASFPLLKLQEMVAFLLELCINQMVSFLSGSYDYPISGRWLLVLLTWWRSDYLKQRGGYAGTGHYHRNPRKLHNRQLQFWSGQWLTRSSADINNVRLNVQGVGILKYSYTT